MSTLFIDGEVAEDRWVRIDGEQPIPDGEDVIVTLTVFEDHKADLLARNDGLLGIYLEAGEQIESITDHLDRIALVALDFPSFADGRAFSKARLLRDSHDFVGEIRATGDVRLDQVQHLRRSGFNAMLVRHQPTIDSLMDIKDTGLDIFYQPAVEDRLGSVAKISGKSWARRAL